MHLVRSFHVLNFSEVSDHCPISTFINTCYNATPNPRNENTSLNDLPNRFNPDSLSLILFRKALEHNIYNANLNFPTVVDNQEGADEILAKINDAILSAADRTISKSRSRRNRVPPAKNKQKWFNNKCRSLKSKLNRAKKTSNPINLTNPAYNVSYLLRSSIKDA